LPRLGGLTSYSAGADFRDIAAYIDKLLKGAKTNNITHSNGVSDDGAAD